MSVSTQVLRRSNRGHARELRRAMSAGRVRDVIGRIEPGCEIFGLTKGDYSLIDIIEHVLEEIGRSDVVVSTWTAAAADVKRAHDLLTDKRVASLRFLVDRSFPSRQPEYCAGLVRAFGKDTIRMTRSHCKFVLLDSGDLKVVIRTSMNLNENRRVENFEISEDPAFHGFLMELVDEIFQEPFEYTEGHFSKLGQQAETGFEALGGWANG